MKSKQAAGAEVSVVACGKKAEQGVLHTVLGQYVTESVNGIMHEAHRLYFLYFALLAEGFLDILQVCSASGEYDSGEQLILITGELQLVPYIGKDFFGACSDDVVQRGQLNGASVFQCTYGGCLALFLFLVEALPYCSFSFSASCSSICRDVMSRVMVLPPSGNTLR